MNALLTTTLLAAALVVSSADELRQLRAATAAADSKCEQVCPSNYQPVCGTNGVTYANACRFSVAECKAKKRGGELRIVVEKACPTDRALCGNLYCDKYQSCLKNDDGVSKPFVYCADLCDASNCGANELCVRHQVACFNAPCPELKSCVRDLTL